MCREEAGKDQFKAPEKVGAVGSYHRDWPRVEKGTFTVLTRRNEKQPCIDLGRLGT